jgi:hypothetical protein
VTDSVPKGDPDGVVTAREKYHCPACGAEAHWNPSRQLLICPFCGTESPETLESRESGVAILEHDLAAALRNIPDEARGWKAEKTSVRCQSCHAISVLDPNRVGQRCDFCGSSQLVPYAEVKDLFSPESLLPLKISETQARELIHAWRQGLWLAPNKVKSRALTDTAKGIYLPYWTFDAKVHAYWTAESGRYYYTSERGKRVRRVQWSSTSGELQHTFDDELVPASLGVNAKSLRAVEPFPTGELIPYDPGYLAGWVVERYQIDLLNAASRSRQQMDEKARKLCGQQVPGDTYRNLSVRSTYSDQHFKHILVPIWLLTYTYGAQSYQVVINGVTGNIAGDRPWSWIKIALLVLLAIIVLVLYLRIQES